MYEGNLFKGLMTIVGMTNWLATSMSGSYLPKRVPTLRDILQHEINSLNYKFISRYITIYEAEEFLNKE